MNMLTVSVFLEEPSQRFRPLLEWEFVCSRFPWGLLIILGGGFALAEACQVLQIHMYTRGQARAHRYNRANGKVR